MPTLSDWRGLEPLSKLFLAGSAVLVHGRHP